MDESILNNGTNGLSHESHETLYFTWFDYSIFFAMLGLSTAIGVYFGFFGKKQNSTNEYLLGGKTMGILPISMSLISSLVSGLTLLAVPTDVYNYGASYWMTCFSVMIAGFLSIYVFLPIYYKCQVTSLYEYLEYRFDNKLRLMASFLFTLSVLVYLPVVVYVPALAIAQATGISTNIISPLICIVCIFYTTIGGLKAVVWTDTLQIIAMFGSALAVLVIGIYNLGGIGEVWRISSEGGRVTLDFDLSPFKRETFWSTLIGPTIAWVSHIGANQGTIAKLIALGSMKKCKLTTVIYILGLVTFTSISVLTGLVLYARYHDCDPLTAGIVQKPDQVMPLFVMDIAKDINGLSGIFIAGLVGAALSTLSSTMNAVAGSFYKDFISIFLPEDVSQETTGKLLRLTTFSIGVIVVLLTFLVEKMGALLQLSISFGSISGAPLIGLFIAGMMVPSINAKGALAGTVSCLLFMAWTVIGSQYYKTTGVIKQHPLSVSTENCGFIVEDNGNSTLFPPLDLDDQTESVFFLYRITHYYYLALGVIVVLLIGLPVSYFTKRKDDKPVRRDCIAPVMHWLLPKEDKLTKTNYLNIKEANIVLEKYNNDEKVLS